MKKEETKPRNRRNLSKTLKRIKKNSEILRRHFEQIEK